MIKWSFDEWQKFQLEYHKDRWDVGVDLQDGRKPEWYAMYTINF